ncbi:MAG: hypothetical protein Q7R92_03625 [bacterium]|nr:hypothetical protein [bacterium]
MQAQDLQQIGQLMDEKLKENNKILKEEITSELTKKIDNKIDELAITVNSAFSEQKEYLDEKFVEIDKKFVEIGDNFKEVKEEIAKRPTTDKMFSWADERITTLELDTDKIKYLHREEWKKLPSAPEINKSLIEAGIN